MAFQVPPPRTPKRGEESFPFVIGEQTFKVRKVALTDVDTLTKVASDDAAALDLFAGASKAQQKAVRGLQREQFQALMRAWYADSDVTEGESQASSS